MPAPELGVEDVQAALRGRARTRRARASAVDLCAAGARPAPARGQRWRTGGRSARSRASSRGGGRSCSDPRDLPAAGPACQRRLPGPECDRGVCRALRVLSVQESGTPMSRTGRDLPPRAAVVVIGGGVTGLSTAYHLAAAGVRDVVLVERAAFGSGSTCKAAGGVRAQFSDRVNIELGPRSLRAFERFREQLDQEIDLHQVGLPVPARLPRATSRRSSGTSRCRTSWACRAGCSRWPRPSALSPLIATDGLLAAAYSPTDGHCTPESVVLGYASAARRHGARLVAGCAAHGDRDRRTAGSSPSTPHGGRIETDTVVCAAGAWSREVGGWVGVDLPVTPLRRQILVTDPVPRARPGRRRSRSTSAPASTSTARATGCSWACPTRDETPGFRLGRSDDWLPGLGEVMRTPRPRPRGGRHRGRLGRPVRDDPRPQRPRRRGRVASAGSSTPPASPGTAS